MAETWADQPFKLIQTTKTTGVKVNSTVHYIATDMTMAHNAMLRCLNSIYQQAPYVKSEGDIRDILLYATFWSDWIHHHHETEENVLFPSFERAAGIEGLMSTNIAQHQEFSEGFDAFVKYVKGCLDERSEERFTADKFRHAIDGFAPKLSVHLADEIETLISLDKYDQKKMQKCYADFEKAIVSGDYNKEQLLPLVLGSNDKNFEGGGKWPPVPSFLAYAVAFWISRAHGSVWRFGPCDFWGKKRPLAFGPSGERS